MLFMPGMAETAVAVCAWDYIGAVINEFAR